MLNVVTPATSPEEQPPEQQSSEFQFEDLSSDEEQPTSGAAGGLATAHQEDSQLEGLLALSPENNSAEVAFSPNTVDRLLSEDRPSLKASETGEDGKSSTEDGSEIISQKAFGSTVTSSTETDKNEVEDAEKSEERLRSTAPEEMEQEDEEEESVESECAQRINAQAKAKAISQIFSATQSQDVGIVTDVRTNFKDGSRRLVSMDIAIPQLSVTQRVYPHQMEIQNLEELKAGQLIWAKMVQIDRPPDLAIGPFGLYLLPAHHEKAATLKTWAHRPLLGTGVTEIAGGYQFPFSTNSDISLGEKGVAAALSACCLKSKAKMDEFGITTSLYVLQEMGKTVIATFEHFLESKRKFVDLVEAWEEDGPIEAGLKGARKHCAIGRILETNKYVQGWMFVFQAKILLSHQAVKKHDSAGDFERMCEGAEVEIQPCESFRALETRMALFSGNMKPQPPIAASEAQFESHPALRRLEKEQKRSAMLMLDDEPRIVAQQAPPGSGKTFTVAAIVAALLAQPDLKMLCMAPLNVAVVKICEELVQALEVERVGVVPLALFSGTGKSKYRDQLNRISNNLLESAVTAESFWQQLNEKMNEEERRQVKKEVKKYQQTARKRPRVAKEAKIAEYVLTLEKKRVLCCTLGFAEQIGRLITDRNVIVLDEAGQAPFSQICATLYPLVKIHKLFVTGDRYQLAVNMKDIPEEFRTGFGLDTVLLNMDESTGVDRTTLTINYRSHPQIVRCVEFAAYTPHGEVLSPGPGVFRMLLDFAKMPVAESPIVLINQETPMEAEAASFSAANSGQTETVIKLLQQWRTFPGSVRVISLYSGQAAQIGRELKAHGLDRMALSATADSMQGHESDLVVVVTTVSQRQPNQQSTRKSRGNAFWGDPARVNVSLSRGKHGLVVIGNLMELTQSKIWDRFLSKALEGTVVTTPSFVRASTDRHSHYVRGILVDGDGSVQQDFRFHAEWNSGKANRQKFTPHTSTSDSPPIRFFPPLPSPSRDQWPTTSASAKSRSSPSTSGMSAQNNPEMRQPAVRCWICDQPGHSTGQCRGANKR
uniref:DNA helicase n=1 Tax=Globodera pallida TaxID=36090 RepID=A0A183CLI6_GLOPA